MKTPAMSCPIFGHGVVGICVAKGKLLCINPSGVLADTTSLYTREALVPSSSGNALENHSLLPRETDCHVAALAAPRNDPLEHCPCNPRAMDHRPYRHPSGLSPISRVVAKSMNSVSAFVAKSSVHSLAPPFPSEPAMLGFAGAPFGGARRK